MFLGSIAKWYYSFQELNSVDDYSTNKGRHVHIGRLMPHFTTDKCVERTP